jgi:hypothetical protein
MNVTSYKRIQGPSGSTTIDLVLPSDQFEVLIEAAKEGCRIGVLARIVLRFTQFDLHDAHGIAKAALEAAGMTEVNG